MSEKVPVYDNHIHMSPSGRNVDALKEFEAAGGTGLTLVTLPHKEVPITCGKDFAESYEVTYRLADRAKAETDLEINIAVGPYPILLISLAEQFGLEKAEEMMIEGMELAAKDIAEGRAKAIGEVGRPHFPVDSEI
ncbi:MAG: TatD family hydrolase, partial [Candidatus Methanomethylophilaceae archaeon]|nr:TatD family hydrolase [Candidatus Methanomethylophilaceae archaeon]